jgi:hypothetical protein
MIGSFAIPFERHMPYQFPFSLQSVVDSPFFASQTVLMAMAKALPIRYHLEIYEGEWGNLTNSFDSENPFPAFTKGDRFVPSGITTISEAKWFEIDEVAHYLLKVPDDHILCQIRLLLVPADGK